MAIRKKPVAKGKNQTIFPVVAIGTSAGGLEAITQLLLNLSPDTGMAFIYVQHLNPDYESQLPLLLSRCTKMKVIEAKNRMKMQPNHFYIIPPDKEMTVTDGHLKLSPRDKNHFGNISIDSFFCSLAEKHKEGAIGIILSGSATDGTRGLKAIKTEGGLTFAQDDSAKFSSMPRSAIAEGVVDFVLSPEDIAKELNRLSRNTYVKRAAMKKDVEDEILNSDPDLAALLILLYKETGVDFTNYKLSTIKRRIIRRTLLFKLNDLKDYLKFIKKNDNEIHALFQDLLINVTSFFREPEGYQYLKMMLFPRLIKNKSKGESSRIWIPACSTGEEAYSLAMLLVEITGNKSLNTRIQIFATDLSKTAIAKARLGEYSKSEIEGLSPKRIQKFFTKADGSYRIIKTVREMCVFAPHNVLNDPPFSHIDFISCRNLLIYLENVLQKKLLSVFHYALNDNGYLMLGKSETIGSAPQLFTQLNKKFKIYSPKKETGRRSVFSSISPVFERSKISKPVNFLPSAKVSNGNTLEKSIDNVLLTHYIPESVVINHDMEIVQFRGPGNMFIHPAQGKASLNILKMAEPEITFDLRNAIYQAIKTKKTVHKKNIEVSNLNDPLFVSLEVVPLKMEWNEPLLLILFKQEHPRPIVRDNAQDKNISSAKDRRIKQLEEELAAARNDMRTISEEHETANEELQSANEEIVSSNEELQSINEELETSKEEIESTNEELITTNQELHTRNDQLAEAHAYSEAIITTMHEPMIVLDKELRIKSANISFYKKFNLREEETEGRLLFDLGNRQWNVPRLRELLEDIIPKNDHFHDFEITHSFPSIGERILLLNAERIIQKNNRQQLILLAMEDVTERKAKVKMEKDLWIKDIADTAPVMIWVAETDRKFSFVNKTWLETTGRNFEQETVEGWIESFFGDDCQRCLDVYNKSFDEKKPFNMECRIRRHDGQYRWIMLSGKPRYSISGEFLGFLGSALEIHDEKILKDELKRLVEEQTKDLVQVNKDLEYSNSELKQFAYVASHDLQEPLRKIITYSRRVQKRFRENKTNDVKLFLDKITESGQRMSRLIDDLLNFSRATRFEIKFETVDLNKTIKDVLKDFDLIMQQKKVKLNIAKLPVIEAIPVQMTQLLHNLISNAFKFSSKVDPGVSISSVNLKPADLPKEFIGDRSKQYVRIKIQDNGIGFDPEYAQQIFSIFQRLHNDQSYPGTGIGLALCKKIVANHNGYIYAQSKPERGATFFVILPVTQK
ncbi:MAG: CheR family methyltransferase [Bacteroidia bacterium]